MLLLFCFHSLLLVSLLLTLFLFQLICTSRSRHRALRDFGQGVDQGMGSYYSTWGRWLQGQWARGSAEVIPGHGSGRAGRSRGTLCFQGSITSRRSLGSRGVIHLEGQGTQKDFFFLTKNTILLSFFFSFIFWNTLFVLFPGLAETDELEEFSVADKLYASRYIYILTFSLGLMLLPMCVHASFFFKE